MSESHTKKTLFKNALLCIGDDFNFIKGSLVEEDGIISDIFTEDKYDYSQEFTNIVDCSQYIMTPGFINCHIHLNQLLNRTMLDGKGNDDLIQSMHGRHTKKTDDDRFWASLLSIEEGLEAGTTFFWAFGSSTGRIVEAMNLSGIRGAFTMAKKDTWIGNSHIVDVSKTDEIVIDLENIIKSWKFPLITPVIGVASERAASKELLLKLGKLRREFDLSFNMHVAEGQSPVNELIKTTGKSSVEYLSQFDFFDSNLSLVHATTISQSEIELIAKNNISVCHCPISNARTAVGLMNLKLMKSSGVNICLGTDAASTGNSNNILLEAYSAILLHNSFNNNSNFLSEKDAFRMLTINGAKAIGLEGKIGQLKKGYYADFVLWPINQPLLQPFFKERILNLIIFSGGQIKPQYVYVNGQLIFDNQAKKFDVLTVISKINDYATKSEV